MLLYETLSQPLIFIIVFAVGFLSGFLFDLENYLVFLCNKNKIVKIVLDFTLTLLCCFIFFLTILNQNYGELRFYEILAFAGGIFLERKSLGFVIAKFFTWCYTKFEKLIQKIKEKAKAKDDTRKSETSG